MTDDEVVLRQPVCPCCQGAGCLAPAVDTPVEPAACKAIIRVGAAVGIMCRCLATTPTGWCEDCARWVVNSDR